jgi:cob(I)alamin adenosyltransferase
MVITFLLLSGCAAPSALETSRTVCRELARDLPTYSIKDTPETLEAGARFIDIFNAICNL